MNTSKDDNPKKKPGAPAGNTNAIGNEGGRPTKYKPEYNQQVYELCLLGATDAQIAAFFDISESTLNEWKKDIIKFSEAVKRGKIQADSKVAAALYKRAIGFSYDETTFERIDMGENLKERDIKADVYKKKVVTKMVVPDTGAAMNWLKNRQKDIWRDNVEIDFNKLSDEDLDKLIERLKASVNGQ